MSEVMLKKIPDIISKILDKVEKDEHIGNIDDENIVRSLTLLKLGYISHISQKHEVDDLLDQGWNVDDIEVEDAGFEDPYLIVVNLVAPNGKKAKPYIKLKYLSTLSKEEYGNILNEAPKIASLVEEAVKKREDIRRLKEVRKQIERLKNLERKIVKLENSIDRLENKFNKLREFVEEQGLVEEFVDWVSRKLEEKKRDEVKEEYGFKE